MSVGEVKENVLTIDADKVNLTDLIAAWIVNNWHIAMEKYGERTNVDLAGCLSVVPDSVHSWTRGPKSRGYLAYADETGKPIADSAAALPKPSPTLDDLSLEDLTARWPDQPMDDEVFDAFLHRALYYLVSGRGEELIAHLTIRSQEKQWFSVTVECEIPSNTVTG